MKGALLILCIAAVIFLLRVLAAFVKEGLSSRQTVRTVDSAKVPSSRQLGQVVQMDIEEQQRRPSSRTGKRMAL